MRVPAWPPGRLTAGREFRHKYARTRARARGRRRAVQPNRTIRTPEKGRESGARSPTGPTGRYERSAAVGRAARTRARDDARRVADRLQERPPVPDRGRRRVRIPQPRGGAGAARTVPARGAAAGPGAGEPRLGRMA